MIKINRNGARHSKLLVLTACIATLAAAGCTSSRFDGAYPQQRAAAPAPLEAAPVDRVENRQLPPPVDPASGTQTADLDDPSADGSLENGTTATDDSTDLASVTPPSESSSVTQAGAPISKGEVVGNWRTQAGGASCQMFLTLTKYGSASRGGTRGCSGDLANLRGWDVQGSQLVLYDANGGTIGRLYASGPSRYSGQTSGGTSVTLSR